MFRGIAPFLLAAATTLGCSSAPPPNQMAATPKIDPPAELGHLAVHADPAGPDQLLGGATGPEAGSGQRSLEPLRPVGQRRRPRPPGR